MINQENFQTTDPFYCKGFHITGSRIGLMADSHGHLDSIRNGLALLEKNGAESIIHLGDIFDSLRNDPPDKIFEALQRRRLISVKGNNDYQVEMQLKAGNTFGLAQEQLQGIYRYLRNMPFRVEAGDCCFAHSLPFDGIRSFYEPVDTGSTKRAAHLFSITRYHIQFCGHSHASILFRYRQGKVTREAIALDEDIRLRQSERYILIVGALTRGECGIFNRERLTYRRISFHPVG